MPATANQLPLPVGEGKTRCHSEQKFVPPEEALTLTLSHGRGDGFAANPKKAACTFAEISNPKVQAAFSRRRSRIVPNLSAHPFRQIRLDMRLQRQHIHRIRYIGSIQLHRVFFSNEHIIGGG